MVCEHRTEGVERFYPLGPREERPLSLDRPRCGEPLALHLTELPELGEDASLGTGKPGERPAHLTACEGDPCRDASPARWSFATGCGPGLELSGNPTKGDRAMEWADRQCGQGKPSRRSSTFGEASRFYPASARCIDDPVGRWPQVRPALPSGMQLGGWRAGAPGVLNGSIPLGVRVVVVRPARHSVASG